MFASVFSKKKKTKHAEPVLITDRNVFSDKTIFDVGNKTCGHSIFTLIFKFPTNCYDDGCDYGFKLFLF